MTNDERLETILNGISACVLVTCEEEQDGRGVITAYSKGTPDKVSTLIAAAIRLFAKDLSRTADITPEAAIIGIMVSIARHLDDDKKATGEVPTF